MPLKVTNKLWNIIGVLNLILATREEGRNWLVSEKNFGQLNGTLE
jgi:hypothetical protein